MVDVARWLDSAVARAVPKRAGDERRMRVILAAADAIDELGPEVGMAEVADRAGVQRPNVYRLFDGREQLDAEVARFAASELVRRVRPRFSRPGTAQEVISGVIEAAVAWAAEHPNLYRFLAAQRQTRTWHRARMGRTRFLGEIVDAMGVYMRSNAMTSDPPDGVLAGLMGMVDASIIWWLDHHDETQEQVTARLTRQVELVLRDVLEQAGIDVAVDLVYDPSR